MTVVELRKSNPEGINQYTYGAGGKGTGSEHAHPLRFGRELVGSVVHQHPGDNRKSGHTHAGEPAHKEPGQIRGFTPPGGRTYNLDAMARTMPKTDANRHAHSDYGGQRFHSHAEGQRSHSHEPGGVTQFFGKAAAFTDDFRGEHETIAPDGKVTVRRKPGDVVVSLGKYSDDQSRDDKGKWTQDGLTAHLSQFHGDTAAGHSDPRSYNDPVYSNKGLYERRHRDEHAAQPGGRGHGPQKEHAPMKNSMTLRHEKEVARRGADDAARLQSIRDHLADAHGQSMVSTGGHTLTQAEDAHSALQGRDAAHQRFGKSADVVIELAKYSDDQDRDERGRWAAMAAPMTGRNQEGQATHVHDAYGPHTHDTPNHGGDLVAGRPIYNKPVPTEAGHAHGAKSLVSEHVASYQGRGKMERTSLLNHLDFEHGMSPAEVAGVNLYTHPLADFHAQHETWHSAGLDAGHAAGQARR